MENIKDDLMNNHYLFAELNARQRELLEETMRRIELDDGDILFEMGQPANRFYLVAAGIIRLQRVSDRGDEKVINVMRAGQSFAEALMFHKRPVYPVMAVATGSTILLSFENERFLQILHESVDTCFQVMGHMSIRLHQFVNELDNLTLQNASYRLIHYLLKNLTEEEPPGVELELDMPKHLIASRLSIKPETLSRMLHEMSKRGLISVSGRIIRIHDIAALRSSLDRGF
ncbi:MAG: Crp/Fnr family transcriptional regulator [Gammaproteobacteria bacterium]